MNNTAVDYKKYLDLIRSKEYLELYDYYSRETFMDILGVSRQENPHSSFLRWLLDKKGEHGFGTIPMRKLLETTCLFHDKVYCKDDVAKKSKELFWQQGDNIFSGENEKILEEIRYGRYEIVDQIIANEVVLEKQRRADIFAVLRLRFQRDNSACNLIIVIENKVHSQEHYVGETEIGQTEAYVKDLSNTKALQRVLNKMQISWLNEEDDNKTLKLFIYLNPYKTSEIKDALIKKLDETSGKGDIVHFAKSREFITLNYQYILDGVIEPLYVMSSDKNLIRDRLYDYIRCLGQSRISAMNEHKLDGNDEYLIMAISDRERKLAGLLWERYFPVILPTIGSLTNASSEKTDGFLLNDDDIEFWVSLSNLYRMITLPKKTDDEYTMACKTLKEYVAGVNRVGNIQKSRKHRFVFAGRVYESYKEKSVGLLCRDIIADFVANASGDQKKALVRVRDEVLKWNPNWLREVILFENEVQEISKGNIGIVKNCKYPTKDMSAEGFAGSFFSYMDILLKQNKSNKSYSLPQYDRDYDEGVLGKDYKLEIVLDSGEKAYVAKFWGSDDLQSLIDYLDNNESCNYKMKVRQEF